MSSPKKDKKEKPPGASRPSTPTGGQSGSTHTKDSSASILEKILGTCIKSKDRTVVNMVAAAHLGTFAMLVPQDRHQDISAVTATVAETRDASILPPVVQQPLGAPSTLETRNKPLPNLPPIVQHSSVAPSPVESKSNKKSPLRPPTQKPWLILFPQNVAVPALSITLPPPGTRFEDTAQLACCGNLLRKCFPPSSIATGHNVALDPTQQTLIEPFLQNKNEVNRIYWLTQRVVEEFAADNFKKSTILSEVLLLGPSLDQEYYRKLLNCVINEFEKATLLDVDLLKGLIQLVQCATPDYLIADDLVRILVVLRTRLQETHQQTAKHTYYLALALSSLLDVMVDGKVKGLRRVVDHDVLSALLRQLADSPDPYLKYQATYALQALLHIPNDETRRQCVLRHAGNITMGLLGVASVCKLDPVEFKNGVGHLYKAAGDAHEVATKMVNGVTSLFETGEGLWTSIKGGIFSGGWKLWYPSLREAQEHIQNGRLQKFNHLMFEASCHRDLEFQWGICQYLGEIAVDPLWEEATRQHAVDLLAEFYRNDSIRTPNEGIDRCILNLLRQVSVVPGPTISDHAQLLLQSLAKEGDAAKQKIYRVCLAGSVHPYPIKVRLFPPNSSTLLSRALAIPDVEYDLHRLRQDRLAQYQRYQRGIYIPPQAKPSVQSKDSAMFPLLENVQEFLSSRRQVLLLLGDSGIGKSVFSLHLEHTLWMAYQRGDAIPLYINLPVIDNPHQDMIAKQLQQLGFSDTQIQEFKQHRRFNIICDGYDESQLKKNLYVTNQINQPRGWKAKLVISCRIQYLSQDYRAHFLPQASHYDQIAADLFQEAAFVPFSKPQIECYVKQYVQDLPTNDRSQDRPSWTTEEYMDKLRRIPNLMDLVSNPFLLTLSLKALPAVVDTRYDMSITRLRLYDIVVKQWLVANATRLRNSQLSESEQRAFEQLVDDGFVKNGVRFQKELAVAIFTKNEGNPVVQYTHRSEGRTWKASFFSPEGEVKLLRESSTVTRFEVYYQFIHRSLLEYFYSRTIRGPPGKQADDASDTSSDTTSDLGSDSESDPGADMERDPSPNSGPDAGSDAGPDTGSDVEPEAKTDRRSSHASLKIGLARMSIVNELSIVQFLVERLDSDPLFKTQLLDTIEDSKTDAEAGVAPANAMSILVKAKHRFHGMDLRSIRVSGADLRGGLFDSVDFEGADLSDVNMGKAWLRQTNLDKANMSGVQFEELPYLDPEYKVSMCAYSSDGKLLVVSTSGNPISIYDTTSWSKVASGPDGYVIAISPNNQELAVGRMNYTVELSDILTEKLRLVLTGHTQWVTCVSYSPEGAQIATSSSDSTVRIWSTVSGETVHVLSKHTDEVTGVAFSPSGLQLASSSWDGTVRTWDAKTGELLATMESHSGYVLFVAYSPDGNQIASCDYDGSVRLWDARTYEICHVLSGHRSFVYCVAYSPDGRQLASCGYDETIRLWDPHTGESSGILSGHTGQVSSVVFSPSGDYLASGSDDRTVRLWKTGGDLVDVSLRADVHRLWCVDATPCGSWIVTGSHDGSVRLWEPSTGQPGAIMEGHTGPVYGVAFSPCGKRIASASEDHTVRLWDAQAGKALHVFKGHTDSVRSVAFSPSGHQIVSGSGDTTVRAWDTQTDQPGFTLEGHTGSVIGVVYSPIGHQIASCSIDKTVRLWCSQTGVQQHVLNLDISTLQVVYSPDGQYLVSIRSWWEGRQKPFYWDPESGQPVRRLDGVDIEADLCSFSPDGKRIAIQHGELLHLWDVELGKELEVRGSKIGRSREVKWIQGPDRLCLVTITSDDLLHVWKLVVEKDGVSRLLLVWGTGMNKLTVEGANLEGAVGLSLTNLALMKQRGAIAKTD